MPVATYTFPDGRKAKITFQTREQLNEAIAELENMSGARPEQEEQGAARNQSVIDEMGAGERFLVGAGRGFKEAGLGAATLGSSAAARFPPFVLAESIAQQQSPAATQQENIRQSQTLNEALLEADRPEREAFAPLEEQSTAATIGQFVGKTAPAVAVPALRASTIPRAMAGEALVGGLLGAAEPTADEAQRLQNVGVGALTGGISRGILDTAGMGVQALRGARSEPRAQELGELSRQFDVPLSVGELRGSVGLRRLETGLESLPGAGIRGFRKRQSEALRGAAESLRRQYGEGTEDTGEALAASLKRTLSENKKRAGELFDSVDEAASGVDIPVRMEATREAAQNAINRLYRNTDIRKPSGELADQLQRYAEAAPRSFGEARALRSDLLADVRKIRKQTATGAASDQELAAATSVANALEQDIARFAEEAGGDVLQKYRQANQFFRDKVVPFKERDFRRITDDSFDTDQIFASFVKRDSRFRGRGKKAEQLISKLDMEGKTAAKFAVLDEAYRRATEGAEEGVPFSPAKFASEISALSDANKVLFTKSEKEQLDGFVRLAEVAKRAGQYAENTPTGMRLIDPLLYAGAGGVATVNLPAALAGAGGIKAVSLLLTSDTGRRLLTRASKARGEKEMQSILRQVLREINRLTPRVASQQAAGAAERREQPRQLRSPRKPSR